MMNATLCTRNIDDIFIKCWLLLKKLATLISELPAIWEMPDCVSWFFGIQLNIESLCCRTVRLSRLGMVSGKKMKP